MLKELTYPFDAEYILQNRRKLKKTLANDGTSRVKKRIAILGGATTGIIRPVLEIFLLDKGIEPEFYESEYNRFWQDGMFGTPELDEFRPEIVFIHTGVRNLNMPAPTDTAESAEALLESEYARYAALWQALGARYNCVIIQNNFQPPAYRLLGNLDGTDRRGRVNFVNRMNLRFADYAAANRGFYIHDIAYLSSVCGLDNWDSPEEWYMYKQSPATACVPMLCHSVANIVKAIGGKNKKVLTLDLDNTLWGGVVGDVGQQGLDLGEETPVGQAYREFQHYVKEVSQTGIVLTVASKNDEENALDGLRHPDGYLHPEDFAVIKANWDRKDGNILQTVASLDLLPDSVVFADDNPAERHIVHENVAGAAVPEMTSPESYIRTVDRGGYFEPLSLSGEDLKRNEMYRENAKRAELSLSFADYGEYLKSLDMVAAVGDFPDIYLKRIAQLANKSNQFNLTTRRYTETEIEEIAKSGEYIRLCGKLADRFGDNGVVSVIIAKKNGDEADILLWIMSCRVLKRGMEQLMRNCLLEAARDAGVKTLRGYYYPTQKNGMVRNLLGDLGFEKISEDAEGNTEWTISTDASPLECFIEKTDHPENERK
ncbi:MAG: HAD family hydrolase [Clostridia bacterium]|nr:HAD family hydrolase [Clostridia bacterium]